MPFKSTKKQLQLEAVGAKTSMIVCAVSIATDANPMLECQTSEQQRYSVFVYRSDWIMFGN